MKIDRLWCVTPQGVRQASYDDEPTFTTETEAIEEYLGRLVEWEQRQREDSDARIAKVRARLAELKGADGSTLTTAGERPAKFVVVRYAGEEYRWKLVVGEAPHSEELAHGSVMRTVEGARFEMEKFRERVAKARTIASVVGAYQ